MSSFNNWYRIYVDILSEKVNGGHRYFSQLWASIYQRTWNSGVTSKYIISITSGYAPIGLWWHFKCLLKKKYVTFLRYLSMLRSSLFVKNLIFFLWFSGRVVVPSSKIVINLPRDLWEATLLRRTRSVQWLARSFGTATQTDTQTNILLL